MNEVLDFYLGLCGKYLGQSEVKMGISAEERRNSFVFCLDHIFVFKVKMKRAIAKQLAHPKGFLGKYCFCT